MRPILFVFFFGLTIKLLFLPFAMHSDLLSMYFRAHLMSEYGLWGLPTNQYLAHLIYAFNLKIMSFVSFDLQSLFALPFGLREGSLTSSVGDWLRFAENPNINAALFWFKLPHLIADIGIFTILYRYFASHRHRLIILASWWLNPVNIYAFYIFSRHDVFTLLALLGAVLFAARKQLLSSALAILAAIQIRVQPLMLLPVFVATWWKNRGELKNLFRPVMLVLLISALYFAVINLLSFDQDLFLNLTAGEGLSKSGPSAVGVPSRHAAQAFGSNILGIPIFPLIYAVIGLIYFFFAKKTNSETSRLQQLNSVLVVVMSAYFAINPFSPHYFVWLSIFITLAIAYQPGVLPWYVLGIVGWMMMGLFGTDVTWFSQNLFVPISTDLFRTPQLALILQNKLAGLGFQSSGAFVFGRIILALGMIGIVWKVYQKELNKVKKFLALLILIPAIYLSFPQPVSASPVPVIEHNSYDQLVELDQAPISQTFTSPSDSFGSIEVRLGTNRMEGNEKFVFRLKEAGANEWLYENEYERTDLYNGYYYPFGFPEVQEAEGEEYRFEIARPNYTDLPLHAYRDSSTGNLSFAVIADQPTNILVENIKSDLPEKINHQREFFTLYLPLLTLSVLATLVALLIPESDNK